MLIILQTLALVGGATFNAHAIERNLVSSGQDYSKDLNLLLLLDYLGELKSIFLKYNLSNYVGDLSKIEDLIIQGDFEKAYKEVQRMAGEVKANYPDVYVAERWRFEKIVNILSILATMSALDKLKDALEAIKAVYGRWEVDRVKQLVMGGRYDVALEAYVDLLEYLLRVYGRSLDKDLLYSILEMLEQLNETAAQLTYIRDAEITGVLDILMVPNQLNIEVPEVHFNLFTPPQLAPMSMLNFPSVAHYQGFIAVAVALLTASLMLLLTYTGYGSTLKANVVKRGRRLFKALLGSKYVPSKVQEYDPVVRLYHRFLDVARSRGFTKLDYEAPLEFMSRVSDDELRQPGYEVTVLFEKVKYGLKNVNEEEYRRCEDVVNKLGEVGD